MSLISAESKEEYRSSASDDYSNNKEDSAGFASMFLMCIYEVGGWQIQNLQGEPKRLYWCWWECMTMTRSHCLITQILLRL